VPLDIKLIQLVKLSEGRRDRQDVEAGGHLRHAARPDRRGRAPDVVRFVMLTRKNDVALDFDFDKVTEQSKDNPVFYVQYANARVNSDPAQGARGGARCERCPLSGGAPGHLGHEAELELIRKLAEWPRLVEIAAKGHEPHRVAFYLYELASDFHGLWNKGNDDAACGSCRTIPQFLRRKSPLPGRGRCYLRWPWYPWRHSGRGNALTTGAPARGRRECRGGSTAPQAGAADGGRGL
jgi:arginyl-tRNA synthetase